MIKILITLLRYPLAMLDGYADKYHLHVMRKDYFVFDIQYFPMTRRRWKHTYTASGLTTEERKREKIKRRISVMIYKGLVDEAVYLDEYLNFREKWFCFVAMKIMYFRMKKFVKRKQLKEIE